MTTTSTSRPSSADPTPGGVALTAGARVHRRFGDRSHGDLRIDADPAELEGARQAVAPLPWTWLHQVHGAEVVVVTRPGEHAGAEADAAVTDVPGAVLAVNTADCVPVLLSDDAAGVVGAAHAGWRGAEAGVLQATVDAMVRLGADPSRIEAHVGPCISAAAYEFSQADLTRLAFRYGPDVIGATAGGNPALDLVPVVRSALAEAGLPPHAVHVDGRCTATDTTGGAPTFWSHRARADVGRQASVIWIERDA